MFNAIFSEYAVWSLALIIPAIMAFYMLKKKTKLRSNTLNMLIVVGYLNLAFFSVLPTLPHFNNMVSSLRYSYPVFIPLILTVFLTAKMYHKEEILVICAMAMLIIFPSFPYHPKILFLLIPLLLLGFWAQSIKSYTLRLMHHGR